VLPLVVVGIEVVDAFNVDSAGVVVVVVVVVVVLRLVSNAVFGMAVMLTVAVVRE
jgi:hypothetical protein